MKRILGIALLGLILGAGVVSAQNTTVVSAALTWGMTNQIDTDNDEYWTTSSFVGVDFALTSINSFGLTFYADLMLAVPYLIENQYGSGNQFETELSEFDSVFELNLMGGIGFAPVNNEALYLFLAVGPNLHMETFERDYWFDETLTEKSTIASFGLAGVLGTGFNFGGGLYITASVKGGYNFFGTYSLDIGGDSDSDKIDNFGMPFIMPSLGIGLKL